MCICSFLSCFISWVGRAHLANIFLWTASILCSISIVSPFWMISLAAKAYFGMSMSCPRKDIGLLAECCATEMKGCIWVWENGFRLELNMPEWRRVIQALFLSGFVLLFPVLLMSPFRFCCQCGRMSIRLSRFFAIFTFLSACLFGSAAIYFFYNIVWGENSVFQTLTVVNTWSWAFVMGVVGTCFTFVSSVFWYLDSQRVVGTVTFQHHHHKDQKREQSRFIKR